MSIAERMHFRMMSLVHETLYGLFRDPYELLEATGLRPGQKVLEVGCGPGFFTIPAARIVGDEGSVHALDITPLAVNRVEQKIEAAPVTNVKTVLADAARTGLPDESFDLIFVFGFGHTAGNREKIRSELHRLLKPQGILATERLLWPPGGFFEPLKQQGEICQFRKVG